MFVCLRVEPLLKFDFFFALTGKKPESYSFFPRNVFLKKYSLDKQKVGLTIVPKNFPPMFRKVLDQGPEILKVCEYFQIVIFNRNYSSEQVLCTFYNPIEVCCLEG